MEGTGGQKGRDRQEVRLVRKRNSQKAGFFVCFVFLFRFHLVLRFHLKM